MMISFNVKCKVLTPLFMKGADQQAELRTQSINGILRWWFRVLGGSLEDERRLFGFAGKNPNQGLARISIKSASFNPQDFTSPKGNSKDYKGYNYIGFSLKSRKAIPDGTVFDLIISFHPKTINNDIKKFFCGLWCAFNLGNFGSRSRRGFGSIAIEDVEGDFPNDFKLEFKPQNSIDEWLKSQLDYIKSLGFWQARNDIPFIFSDNFEIYRVEKHNFKNYSKFVRNVQEHRKGKYLANSWGLNQITNHIELLDFMGFLLMAFRSYRNPDYENAKSILQRNREDTLFERPIFGLPLNFFFSSISKKGQINIKKGNENLRRASPLLLKILQFDNQYEGLFIVLKSRFMPEDARLNLNNVDVKLPQNEWKAIDELLSMLKSNNIIRRI
ncbi:type III-B CRISPR module RAMP protein Cmr1 [Hydrogenobaculum acidophilum]